MKQSTAIAAFLVLLSFAGAAFAEEDWVELFNGKDLTGWKANLAPDSYVVADGVLRVHNTSEQFRSHLFYVGGDEELDRFKNFELKVIAKGEPDSNSGIFFHTDYSERDARKHLGKGYEVQLNSAKTGQKGTGSLYAIVDLSETPVDSSQWFELRVIVNDKRIIVKLDGKKVVDYTEPENPERPPNRAGRLLDPKGGAIALQAHDINSIWYFKEVAVRRLPD